MSGYASVLLFACLVGAISSQVYEPRFRFPNQYGQCPPGYRLLYGRCERSYDPYPTRKPDHREKPTMPTRYYDTPYASGALRTCALHQETPQNNHALLSSCHFY